MNTEVSFKEDSGSESGFSEEGSDITETPTKEEINPKKRKLNNITENGKSQKRKLKNELFKPPTVEELNNLKETENLYNNNLFRLQIEELISEVNIKNKRKKNITTWLNSFQLFIDSLPEYEILLSDITSIDKKKMTKLEKLITKLANYKQFIKTDQDVTLKLTKPESYENFGLFEYNSLPGPNLILKINLKMPKSCFNLKDFLNNRYLCKRYYYLLYIAEQLKSSTIINKVSVSFHENNILLPVLDIEPNGCDKSLVKIYVSPSQDYFKPNRYLPEQNNIKQDLFDTDMDTEVLKNTPTVLYNSTLAHDVTLSINNEFVIDILREQKNVQEGIKLLCIWLKQREFNIGLGSFSEDLIVYIVAYLFSKKKINKFMSSYQVIRNFWNFIATTDLQKEAISIVETPQHVLDSFRKHFDLVILDKSGCFNVASFLNLDVYKKVKYESQLALKHLDNNKNNSFQHLFLTKFPFHLQYDLVLDLTKSLPLESKFVVQEQQKVNYLGYQDLLTVNYITKIIQKGLGKRTLSLVPRLELEKTREVKRLLFGVNLNPDEAFNFIEVGPALNDHTAADEFRKFWGHLSSDRRFRDGSTNVAVHFRTNTIKGKRDIIRKILDFVITEKLSMKYKLHYNEFEEVLLSKRLVPSYPSGTNEETTLKIIQASDELAKKIRGLQMSLKIVGVQGVTDVYTFTELFPPIPTNYKVGQSVTTLQGNNLVFSGKKSGMVPRYVQPVTCVLQLEHSSKWPNDLEALRHIKTSFYLEISKMLQKDHEVISHVTPQFIDVYFEGIVFRYYLHIPKEMALMKKGATELGLTCFRDSEESAAMERMLNVMPKVVGALKGVQSLYPSYGLGTALVKRWLRSQLIDDSHFPDLVINLLNASLYLSSFSQSNTPQISFLRFLKFMSEFDWNLQTVLVNFNDDITNEEISELESKLQQNREAFPPLYIITPYDQGLSVFTKNSPSKELLCRVKHLATESLKFIDSIIVGRNLVGIKELFIPNFDGYNVLIHLRPLANPRRHEQIVFSSLENRIVLEKYKEQKDNMLPITDFNPVEKYLALLRLNYGKFAMFFHDSYGGNTVGVLWTPKINEVADFKVSRVNGGRLVDEKIVFNMDAVIEDFYVMGRDLVKTIEKR